MYRVIFAVLLICSPIIGQQDQTVKAGEHYRLGMKAAGEKEFPRAALEFRQALDSDPGFPGAHKQLGLALFQTGFTVDVGRLSAASAIVLIPSVTLFVFLRRHFVQGVASTGLKE